MKKQEYKILYIRANMRSTSGLPDDLNVELNKYAGEGWILDKIVPKLRGGIFLFGIGRMEQTVRYLIFMRKDLP